MESPHTSTKTPTSVTSKTWFCKNFDEKKTKSDQKSKILMCTQNQQTFFGVRGGGLKTGVKKSSQK